MRVKPFYQRYGFIIFLSMCPSCKDDTDDSKDKESFSTATKDMSSSDLGKSTSIVGISLVGRGGAVTTQPSGVDKCIEDMKDDNAFQCVKKLVDSMDNAGTPSETQMAACGCKFVGTGKTTGVGERPVYACPGTPPFYASPVPGYGKIGIIVPDGNKYPECMFDLTDTPTGAGPVKNPDEKCTKCHFKSDPVIPIDDPRFPFPEDPEFPRENPSLLQVK
jgi:hypothetical protein